MGFINQLITGGPHIVVHHHPLIMVKSSANSPAVSKVFDTCGLRLFLSAELLQEVQATWHPWFVPDIGTANGC